MKYTGENSLTMLITLIKGALGGKVDKVTGKSLSTNDYTTGEKTKLAGLSNYELPAASASTRGGIRIGTGLTINGDVLSATATGMGNVESVNGQTGVVVLDAEDVGALPADTPIPEAYDDTEISGRIDAIGDLIPEAATTSNQLADKAFVNSTVGTNTAIFRGTFDSLAELQATEATNNDYGIVVTTDANNNTVYNRYKYNGTNWAFEYSLNNSSFTATQWAAINSGVDSSVVSKANSALQSADLTEYTNSEIQSFWNSVSV